MTIRKTFLTAAVLCVVAPAIPALAHDNEDDGGGSHGQVHNQLGDAHERAHDEGFESGAEHRTYHRALRNIHEGYHDERDGYRSYYAPRYYTPRYYYAPRYRSYGYGW